MFTVDVKQQYNNNNNNDSELWLPWQLKGPTDLNGKNVVRSVALLVLMAPSNLQVSMTPIKFRTSSNFSHIVQVLKLPLSALKAPSLTFSGI